MEAVNNIEEIKYPMKAACLLSGLPADTLRAWERRYSAVKPDRKNGRRLYSHTDIQRLKLLKWAVDHGHRISHVVNLKDTELIALQGQTESDQPENAQTSDKVTHLVDLVKEFSPEADLELTKLAALMSPKEFVFDVVLPMMAEVGSQWESGRLSIAQEHFTTAAIRNILGIFLRTYGSNPQAPAIIFSTPSGEHHEIGILIAAMIASNYGFRPVFLGVNLPLAEIADAAHSMRAMAVVISIHHRESSAESAAKTAQRLRKLLPRETGLIVGGSQCDTIQVRRAPEISIAPTFEIFESIVSDTKDALGEF